MPAYWRDGENNLPSILFKICTEFSEKVYEPVKPQRIISKTIATRRWECFAKDFLSTVFSISLL